MTPFQCNKQTPAKNQQQTPQQTKTKRGNEMKRDTTQSAGQ